MNIKPINDFIEIRKTLDKGFGVFARKNIPIHTKVYEETRMKLSKEMVENIIQHNDENTIQKFLSWGWAEENIFIFPLGVETYINHNDNPNMKNNISCKYINSGEELTEDYTEFDKLENWYLQLTQKYNVWIKKF
jgi:hypothetical protein